MLYVIIYLSFPGGLILMKYLQSLNPSSRALAGAGWLCSLPPSGQGKMATRFLFKKVFRTVNIIRGMAFGHAKDSPKLSKLLFFDSETSESDISKYIKRLSLDAYYGEDIKDLELNLPSLASNLNAEYRLKKLVLGSKTGYLIIIYYLQV